MIATMIVSGDSKTTTGQGRARRRRVGESDAAQQSRSMANMIRGMTSEPIVVADEDDDDDLVVSSPTAFAQVCDRTIAPNACRRVSSFFCLFLSLQLHLKHTE